MKMSINIVQAIILGLFASLSSMPGLGGTSIGNYTLGRPLVGGLICGIVLGDIPTGILVGCAMQVVYIALVTPGGTVSADVRAVSYIGIPLAMIALKSYGLDPASRRNCSGNFFRHHGRYHRYCPFLRHSYHEPGLAAHGLGMGRQA